MLPRRYCSVFLAALLVFLLPGCAADQPACPTGEGTQRAAPALKDLLELPPPSSSGPIEVLVGGRTMQVDKLVDYPLCNDNWSGTVYVSCEVQVAQAELDAGSNPLFLQGCNLKIAANTVVYVAAHNDAAFYQGCSCHAGTASEP